MFYLTIVNKVLHHCHFWLARQYIHFFLLQGSLSVMKKLVEVHPRNNKQNDSESESEGTVHNLTSSSKKKCIRVGLKPACSAIETDLNISYNM